MATSLGRMLGGAFASDESPLARLLTPPPSPTFDGSGFAPQDPVDTFAPDPAPMPMPTPPPGPDLGMADLFDPELPEPSMRRQLMETIAPLIAATAVGTLGGGMAGATGLLQGSAAGLAQAREQELLRAKYDAERRRRAFERAQALEKQQYDRAKAAADATSQILARAAEFEDPAAARAWLDAAAPTYAPLGVDTRELGQAVGMQAQQKVRAAAMALYEKAIANVSKLTPPDQQVDPETLHRSTSVNFRGRTMTLGELAEIAGSPVPGPGALKRSAKDDGQFAGFLRDKLDAFEAATGRPANREERVTITLEARKEWAQADDDPLVRELNLRRLKILNEKANGSSSGSATWTPAQRAVASKVTRDYISSSKDFATRAQAWDTMQALGPRVQNSPQAQMALVFAFMKLLDPGSVVRETEYANAAETAGVPERVRQMWNKLVDGRFLSPEQIRGILAEGRANYAAHRKTHQRRVDMFAQTAARQSLNPWDVLIDYNAMDDPMQITGFARPPRLGSDASGTIAPVTPKPAGRGATPAAGGGRTIGRIAVRAPNGKTYYFSTPEQAAEFKRKAGIP